MIFFAAPGLAYGLFVSRVPALTMQVKATADEFGMVLLCIGIAAVAGLAIASYCIGRFGAKTVLLSLGKDGAVITNGSKNYYCRSINVAVNSTVGAGDGMVAAAAVKMQEGADLPEILRAGVAAGTATVTTFGTVSFTKEKYEEIYRNLLVTEF